MDITTAPKPRESSVRVGVRVGASLCQPRTIFTAEQQTMAGTLNSSRGPHVSLFLGISN